MLLYTTPPVAPPQALPHFGRSLVVAMPGHLQSRINRALVLEALGRREEALVGYRCALDLASPSEAQVRRVAAVDMKRLASVSENESAR